MKSINLTYSGPTSPLPVDIYTVGSAVNVTVSGTGTLQYTTRDPFNTDLMAGSTVWTTVSPGNITMPVTAFRMASGAGSVLIVQQGVI